jgi:hypothetical protein
MGETLVSLPREDLVEVAILLDMMLASKIGRRLRTDRAHRASSTEDLHQAIRALDQNLERFRPWAIPSLPAPGSRTGSASTSNRSRLTIQEPPEPLGPGAMGDLLDGS